MIDSHVHFWRYQQAGYPWIDAEMTALRQDRLPEHYPNYAFTGDENVSGLIAVQARCSEAENDFLLELAGQYERVCGVVGWLDFCADDVVNRIEHYAENPLMVGFRHLVQDEPNPSDFWATSTFNRGIDALQQQNIAYDVLVKQADLLAVETFCAKHDKAPLIIDHLAKPSFVGKTSQKDWIKRMRNLASMQHVVVKLSGVPLEAGKNANPELIYSYWSDAVKLFGAERCLWGSDWSVSLLGHDYPQLMDLWFEFAEQFNNNERKAIHNNNAVKFYGLDKNRWESA